VEFWASSETSAAADAAIEKIRRAIEPMLQDLLRRSQFATTKLLVRYVPIVMRPELIDRYPPRSEARLEQRVLDCAPELDYETFVRGSFVDQVRAYVDGLRTASVLLPEFGFSLADAHDFEALLLRAADNCTS
jgi:hypothetical protein